MTASLELLKDGAEQFLLRLLPQDKAQVGEFNDKIKCHPGAQSAYVRWMRGSYRHGSTTPVRSWITTRGTVITVPWNE